MLLFSILQGGLQGWQLRKAPEPHGAGVVWGSGLSAAARGDPAWSQSSSCFGPIKLTPQGKYSRSSQAHGSCKAAQLGLSPPTRGSTSSPGQDHSCFVFGNKAVEALRCCCGAMMNGGCDQRSAHSYGLCYSSAHTNTSLFTASDVETSHVLLSRVLPSRRSGSLVVTEGWRAAARAFGAQGIAQRVCPALSQVALQRLCLSPVKVAK